MSGYQAGPKAGVGYQDESGGFPGWNGNNVRAGGTTYQQQEQEVLKSKTSNSLYQQAAKQLGITNFNSWNDVKQIEAHLAGGSKGGNSGGGGGGPSPSGSSGSSGGQSGQVSGSVSGGNGGAGGNGNSGSGGNLNQQAKAGQAAAAGYQDDAGDLQSLLSQLTMGNQSSAQALTDMMNMQAMTSSLHMAQQQQEMQLMAMGMQQQVQASNMQAMMQFAAMQQQQATMIAAQKEQQRIATNLGRAHVPTPEKTAGVTPVGDYRDGAEARNASKLSEMRDLSFLPGTYTGGDKPKTLVLA